MGLYDSYQLANSSGIKQFQGSAVPELMQVGQQLQQQYETGRNADDITARMIPNTSALEEDQGMLMGLRDKYKQRIGQRAQRGDYENMYRDTIMDSKDFVQEYKPIAENQQRYQAYQKDLQDKLDKGYLKSPDTIKKLLAASRYGYKGLQKDPVTGETINKFQGLDPAKEINITEWVDKALDHFAPQIVGGKVTKVEGDYYVTRGGKTTRLGQDRIDEVLNAAKKLDPEWQSYIKQKATLDTIGYESATDKDAVKMFGAGTASQLMDIAKNAGLPLGAVVKAHAQAAVVSDLDNTVRAYSSKFQRNDSESEYGVNETEAAGRNAALKEAPERFLAPAPDTKLEEKDRDIENIRQTVTNLQGSLDAIDKGIAKATGSEKQVLMQQRLAVQDQIAAKNTIIKGAEDAVAGRMGFKNATEFNNKIVGSTLDAAIQPIGGTDERGNHVGITKENLKKIIMSGQYEKDEVPVSTPDGATSMAQVGYKLRTSNGIIKVSGANLDKMFAAVQGADNAKKSFNDAVKQEVQDNAQNYAMKPMQMSLSKQESESLKGIIMGNPSGHAFFKPGSTERVKDGEAPKDFTVDNIQLMQKGGSYYLTAHELSTDKKTEGNPTGQTYNIQVTPGSNYGKVIASNLVKAKQYLSPDMMKAAAQLAGFTYTQGGKQRTDDNNPSNTGDILNLQNNEPLIIRQDGQLFATVKRVPYESPTLAGQSRYVLYNTKGGILKESPDASAIDDAVRTAVENRLREFKQ